MDDVGSEPVGCFGRHEVHRAPHDVHHHRATPRHDLLTGGASDHRQDVREGSHPPVAVDHLDHHAGIGGHGGLPAARCPLPAARCPLIVPSGDISRPDGNDPPDTVHSCGSRPPLPAIEKA